MLIRVMMLMERKVMITMTAMRSMLLMLLAEEYRWEMLRMKRIVILRKGK